MTDGHDAVERISATGRVRRLARSGTVDVPAIVTAPDGSAWFTDYAGRSVNHITPAGRITRYRTGEGPTAIAIGPDGAIWFTLTDDDDADGGLGRIDANGPVAVAALDPRRLLEAGALTASSSTG